MSSGKLLVYSDGGAPRRHPYASYAAYDVGFETDWKSDLEAHAKLSCRMLYDPVVYVARAPLYPKRLSNTEAEARAMRMAVCWAGHYCSEHPNVSAVEFCSDDRTLVEMLNGSVRVPRRGSVHSDFELIHANIRRNLRKIELKWTWIPGDVMKTTIINH